MRMALRLAKKGGGRVSPNPLVGAVIVKEGEVVGKGYHRAYGKAHAEVVALQDAGEKSKGATLYVNLEPCNHTGHTPPCTQAILKAGIARVVIGMRDPNPRVSGGGVETLRAGGVAVTVGVLNRKCQELNAPFVHFVTRGTPYGVMKIAATLDGKIATRTGESRWVTGEKARRFVHHLRGALDAVAVGIGTVLKDDPTLTCRLPRPPHQPLRVVLDTHLSLPEGSKLLKTIDTAPLLIATGPEVDEKKRSKLRSMGVEILSLPLYNTHVDVRQLMVILAKRSITSVLFEGGSRLNAAALAAGIVQKIYIFYAPKLLGGQDSLAMIGGSSPEHIKEAIPVYSGKIRKIGNDFLFEGFLESRSGIGSEKGIEGRKCSRASLKR